VNVVAEELGMGDDARSLRTWQEIAEEASREKDPEKLQKLTEELERALDARRKELHPEEAEPESQI
jgi:uncharacterized membrane protein (DUF106 family)